MSQTFACKYAYLDKGTGKNQVVLCEKAGTPDFSQYKSIVKCMCAYQPPCPEKLICALAKGWEGCFRLVQERMATEESNEAVSEPKKAKSKRAKKE